MWCWNLNTDIIRGGPGFAFLFGLSEEDVERGISVNSNGSSISEEIRRAFNDLRSEIMASRSVEKYVMLLPVSLGSPREVVVSASLLLTEEGGPDCIIGVVADYSLDKATARDNAAIIVDKLLETRVLAKDEKLHFLTYLIDMALTEIGYILADRDRNRETRH